MIYLWKFIWLSVITASWKEKRCCIVCIIGYISVIWKELAQKYVKRLQKGTYSRYFFDIFFKYDCYNTITRGFNINSTFQGMICASSMGGQIRRKRSFLQWKYHVRISQNSEKKGLQKKNLLKHSTSNHYWVVQSFFWQWF